MEVMGKEKKEEQVEEEEEEEGVWEAGKVLTELSHLEPSTHTRALLTHRPLTKSFIDHHQHNNNNNSNNNS